MLTLAGVGALEVCCPKLFWATSVMAQIRAIFDFIGAAFLAKGCGPFLGIGHFDFSGSMKSSEKSKYSYQANIAASDPVLAITRATSVLILTHQWQRHLGVGIVAFRSAKVRALSRIGCESIRRTAFLGRRTTGKRGPEGPRYFNMNNCTALGAKGDVHRSRASKIAPSNCNLDNQSASEPTFPIKKTVPKVSIMTKLGCRFVFNFGLRKSCGTSNGKKIGVDRGGLLLHLRHRLVGPASADGLDELIDC